MGSLRWHALMAALACAASCGGDPGHPLTHFSDLDQATADARSTPEAGGPETDGEVVETPEVKPIPEVWLDFEGGDEGGAALGQTGDPCSDNSQCASGWCLQGDEGAVCTEYCIEECPPGWRCVTIANTPPDVVSVCFPSEWILCGECESDDDCGGAGDHCLQVGTTGTYCGVACTTAADCPADYECAETDKGSQCLPQTGSCVCTPKLLGTTRPCTQSNEFGTCSGEETCTGPDGWTGCTAAMPAEETCNGQDDDCDGDADEQLVGMACEVVNEWGTCPGVTECDAGEVLCVGPTAAMETCNGEDDDCDGDVDEEFLDFGKPCDSDDSDQCFNGTWTCAPDGLSLVCDETAHIVEVCDGQDNDCDTSVDEPGALGCMNHYMDVDGDSWGGGDPLCTCTVVAPYTAAVGGDCDDADPVIHPGQKEACNLADDDCNGEIDEGSAAGCKLFYKDQDKDGTGDAALFACLCHENEQYPTPFVGDCNDFNPSIYPDAVELCDLVDNDCDGQVDQDAVDCTPWYLDLDGDGFGVDASMICSCSASGTHTAMAGGDCNDSDPTDFPGNPELCDNKDNDCDFEIDEAGAGGCTVYYADQDNDGFGPDDSAQCLCQPTYKLHVVLSGDCDDLAADVHPGAFETCDGLDNNCNGKPDEPGSAGCVLYYADKDGDGFGDSKDTFCLCQPAPPYTAPGGGDCNDNDPLVTPLNPLACGQDADCCIAGQVCYKGLCIPKPAACLTGDDCPNDSACTGNLCLPYETPFTGEDNPTCTRPYNPGIFHPAVQCKWTGPEPGDPFPDNKQVLSTVLVADFNLDNDDKTVRPSLVVTTYSGLDGGFPAASSNGDIRILDGSTCVQQFHLGPLHETVGASPAAIGDLDLAPDERPEIVAFAEGGGLVAFKYDAGTDKWTLLWHSTNADGSKSTLASDTSRWNGPSLYDLDGDGKPEVLMGAVVHDSKGKVVASNLGYYNYSVGHFPLVADVDLDGKAELVMGNGIYEFKGTSWQKESYFTAAPSDGFTAVANFGDFPVAGLPKEIPEVVVISAGQARLMNLAGTTVFGPYTLPAFPPGTGSGTGGPPTIGDFDGDGRPEFALAGMGAYTVFDLDCAGAIPPMGCYASGILWTYYSQDYSSSVTGSSIFDFEADGLAEAVYSDECYTRVYSGQTGQVLFSQPRTSCTWYENPVIADVDGDFKSELVVGSNTNCGISCQSVDPIFRGLRCKTDTDCPGGPGSCVVGYCRCKTDADCGGAGSGFTCTTPLPNTPGTGNVCRSAHSGKASGVIVYRDTADAWVDSRPLWNQHAYFVTNANADGTIPPMVGVKQNWQTPGLNNYRQNVQGAYSAVLAPDITVDPGYLASCTEQGLTVPVRVCNRGAAPVDSGIVTAFFLGNPDAGGKIQCLEKTTIQLFPGDCEELTCQVGLKPGDPPQNIIVVADYGGNKGMHTECFEENNHALFAGVDCNFLWE